MTKMKNKKVYLISLIVLIIDLISKIIVKTKLAGKESFKLINKVFYLTFTKNKGIAFSFLEGNKPFIIIATIIIILIIINYIRKNYLVSIEQIGYGLIIGGAIGNLIDRLVYGYVIDFIDFKIINYPIFNIADSAIVIGVIIIIIKSFKRK